MATIQGHSLRCARRFVGDRSGVGCGEGHRRACAQEGPGAELRAVHAAGRTEPLRGCLQQSFSVRVVSHHGAAATAAHLQTLSFQSALLGSHELDRQR